MNDPLKINIEGKLFSFSTSKLSKQAQEELFALFYEDEERKQISIVELLQAYIIAIEKYAKIHTSLELLYYEIENASISPQNITSQTMQDSQP